MQRLATTFSHREDDSTQLRRNGKSALYERRTRLSGHVLSEGIRLLVRNREQLGDGVVFPRREVYPSTVQWDNPGWTFFSRARADLWFEALVAIHTVLGSTIEGTL